MLFKGDDGRLFDFEVVDARLDEGGLRQAYYAGFNNGFEAVCAHFLEISDRLEEDEEFEKKYVNGIRNLTKLIHDSKEKSFEVVGKQFAGLSW